MPSTNIPIPADGDWAGLRRALALLAKVRLTDSYFQPPPNPVFTDLTLSGTLYFGDANTDGSWRITTESGNLVVQHRESGSWVTTHTFSG